MYFRPKTLIRYMVYRCFLHFCGLAFYFLHGILYSTTVFNFDEVQFIYFVL